jgi:transposase
LFAALDVATGKVIGNCQQQHRHQEFLKFLELIDEQIPETPGVEIHLVMDNYATHKTPKVQRWLARRPRYHVHFTPTSASWLNQVERFFAEITEKRIRRGAFRSVKALRTAIEQYLDHHNKKAKPFVWTADAELIQGQRALWVNVAKYAELRQGVLEINLLRGVAQLFTHGVETWLRFASRLRKWLVTLTNWRIPAARLTGSIRL